MASRTRRAGETVMSVVLMLVDARAMTSIPLPRFNVNELSVEDFDRKYRQAGVPVILSGVSTCPAGTDTFDKLDEVCSGIIHGSTVRRKTNESRWAGLGSGKDGEDDVSFMDYVRRMGTNAEKEFVFDLPMFGFCPSLLLRVGTPKHFSKIFSRQWRWRHLDDKDANKCADMPMYNLYMAEAGFESNLHVDGGHTAFTASMCIGRKKWRVVTRDDFERVREQINGTAGVMTESGGRLFSEPPSPFETWRNDSQLHSLDVDVYEGLLEPGETIYIPPGAPHAAVTLDNSLMVASNDQLIEELEAMREACRSSQGSAFGHCMADTSYQVTFDNYKRLSDSVPREASSFLDSYGCEKVVKSSMGSVREVGDTIKITPANFNDVVAAAPVVVVKTRSTCLHCTRLYPQLASFGAKFSPPLRVALLDCTDGCPVGDDPGYQLLKKRVGNFPELSLIMSSDKNKTWTLDSNKTFEAPLSVSYFYGPRELEFYMAWASFASGSRTSAPGLPWWQWNALLGLQAAIWMLAACVEAVGYPAYADGPAPFVAYIDWGLVIDDGGTIALAGVVLGIVVVGGMVVAILLRCCLVKRKKKHD